MFDHCDFFEHWATSRRRHRQRRPLPPLPQHNNRFQVVDATTCGTVLFDSGFIGEVDVGCAESAPCCLTGSAPGCTGVAGDFCPAFPGAVPAPGGGEGVAPDPVTITPTTNKIYVQVYGGCPGTVSILILFGGNQKVMLPTLPTLVEPCFETVRATCVAKP